MTLDNRPDLARVTKRMRELIKTTDWTTFVQAFIATCNDRYAGVRVLLGRVRPRVRSPQSQEER